jgi:hypothetical protein
MPLVFLKKKEICPVGMSRVALKMKLKIQKSKYWENFRISH